MMPSPHPSEMTGRTPPKWWAVTRTIPPSDLLGAAFIFSGLATIAAVAGIILEM